MSTCCSCAGGIKIATILIKLIVFLLDPYETQTKRSAWSCLVYFLLEKKPWKNRFFFNCLAKVKHFGRISSESFNGSGS